SSFQYEVSQTFDEHSNSLSCTSTVERVEYHTVIDTGAAISIAPNTIHGLMIAAAPRIIKMADGSVTRINKKVKVNFQVNNVTWCHTFYTLPNINHILLGMDFLKNKGIINLMDTPKWTPDVAAIINYKKL